MKSELLFLGKMAVALTVVDAFIPRAEMLAKSKMDNNHHSQQSTCFPKSNHYEIPQYRPNQQLASMHTSLFQGAKANIAMEVGAHNHESKSKLFWGLGK